MDASDESLGHAVVVSFDHTIGPKPATFYFQEFDRLREQGRVIRSTESGGYWMLTRYDDIRDAYKSPETFTSDALSVEDPNPSYRFVPQMVPAPDHTMYRRLLAPMFAPATIAGLESKMRGQCAALIDGLIQAGSCDLMADFALPFVTEIFLDMLGLPVSELPDYMHWVDVILNTPANAPDADELRGAATRAVMEHFAGVIAERRAEPRQDMVTAIVSSADNEERISDEDLLSLFLNLFLGGLDTVKVQLGWFFFHLANHPEDLNRVVSNPRVLDTAIEELLRVYSIAQPARKVGQDTVIDGCPMRSGEMVLLPLASACRDPRVFAGGGAVDITRPANQHLAFGAGPHRCLGAHLARMELRVALEEWHRRIPAYTVDSDEPLLEHGRVFALERLPLRWSA
jgi:cytochrome P450